MASSRMAKFVSEVAPPQFVSLMRRRTSKVLDTISEDEREVSMNESSSHSSTRSHQTTSGSSILFFKQAQRKFSVVLDCLANGGNASSVACCPQLVVITSLINVQHNDVWSPNVITFWEALLTVMQFVLLLIHAYAQDKRCPFISLPLERSERPEEWVPAEVTPRKTHYDDEQIKEIADIFSIHEGNESGSTYQHLPLHDPELSINAKEIYMESDIVSVWKQQFVDALMMENLKLREPNNSVGRVLWNVLVFPWKLLFAFVPPYQIASGWIAFICSLIFISGIAYIVTRFTDLISCATGINSYVIAFTALASGTSWPDLVASKIAAERQTTVDSAIANITCSNSVNIYVGIGVPWLINTTCNLIAYAEPLHIKNAEGLSFSLLVFFSTSVGCISVLVLRRVVFGGELEGPRVWAWITCAYFMLLWFIFVILSSLKVSGII